MLDLALVFGGSFLAGYLGAVVGLVLGTLRLPFLLLAAGSPAAAAGANIAISAAAAASGGYRHARDGRIDWRVVAWMAPASAVGAVAGALLTGRAPEDLLLGVIAAILLWSGADLIVRPFGERPTDRPPRLAPAAGFGFAIGLVGGAIGVILGTLRMPALLRAVGLSAHRAVGTNLVVGFVLGACGFVAHAARDDVAWALLGVGLLGALPGAWLGARLTPRLSEETLRRAIGVALVVIAGALAAQAAL